MGGDRKQYYWVQEQPNRTNCTNRKCTFGDRQERLSGLSGLSEIQGLFARLGIGMRLAAGFNQSERIQDVTAQRQTVP